MTKPSPTQGVDSRVSFGSLIAAGIIVAALFCVGLAVSAALYYVTPKVFESSATVLIEPRDPALILNKGGDSGSFDYRHDQLIGEDNIITKALIKYDLQELVTLRDLTPIEQIQLIQNNLAIQPSEDTDDLYHLRFRSSNPRDAQTVLATLVSTYEKHLEEKYRDPRQDEIKLLLKMKERFVKDLTAQTDKIEQLEKQIAAGQNDEDTRAKLKELQTEVERTRAKISTAEAYLEEDQHSQTNLHKGFKFTTLSPASRGVSISSLPVFLLLGGGIGALIGLIIAGLMIAFQSIRR